MNSQVVLRLLETFFRHKWLYLVPVVLLGAGGVWAVRNGEDSYQSTGTMKVEPTALVAELTGSQTDPGFGWETPAGATAASLGAMLRTESFVDDVATTAGLADEMEAGVITPAEVRGSLAVYPDGVRLVKVVGTNRSPVVANELASAAITSYIETVEQNEARNSVVARDFLQERLPEYEADVAGAEEAFAQWLAANPPPEDSPRPEGEVVELERLQGAVGLADERLNEVRADIERAEVSVLQKEAEVQQRFEIVDQPEQATAPQPKLKKAVLTLAMALLLGCFVALGAVVLITIFDRTIRFPGDAKDRLGARVLAVVPRARLTPAMRKRLESADADDVTAIVRARAQGNGDDLDLASFGSRALVRLNGHGARRLEVTHHKRAANGARASVTLKKVK